MSKIISISKYISPAGELILGSYEDKLCLCDWARANHRDLIDRRVLKSLNAHFEYSLSDVISKAISQLDEYFAGDRTEFSIPILFSGTFFQCGVWSELLKIPYGETISYSEQAYRIGCPKAVRAVASANAANPISIFVPCHRVIGMNGKLSGYGGGLDAKRFLLNLEAKSIH